MSTVFEDIMKKSLEHYGQFVFGKWNSPKDAVYIGRGSIYGNPFPMTDESHRLEVCEKYFHYVLDRLKTDLNFRIAVIQLHHRNLECFCSNGTCSLETKARYCHGHLLATLADALHQGVKDDEFIEFLENQHGGILK